MPCRRVYHTGKSVLPKSKWQPLAAGDTTFAEIAGRHGLTSGFIVDTYHHFKPDYNFHRGFDSWQWVRGQETDKWKSGPKEAFDPRKHMPPHLWNEGYDRNMRQYMMNTQDRRGPEDYFCAQSCEAAAVWLQQNRTSRPFMLWIDMFDPHEPWDAPPEFQKMYRDEYPYERYLFGYGVRNQDIRPDDLPVIRDLYAAEVTFSDHRIGRLLEQVEKLELLDDTVIVFSTDHGTHLGEEGCVQKTPALLNRCVTHIPLIKACAQSGLPIIMSAGGATLGETEEAVQTVLEFHDQLKLLHCSIQYPTALADCNLGVIRTLKTAFSDIEVGYSDHTMEISDAAVQSVFLADS